VSIGFILLFVVNFLAFLLRIRVMN